MTEEGVEYPGAIDSGSFWPLNVDTYSQAHRAQMLITAKPSLQPLHPVLKVSL